MSEDTGRRWPRWAALVLAAGLLVTAAYGSTYQMGQNARFQTDSGAVVVFGSDTSVESGNPFTASDEVTLDRVGFRSPGNSKVRIETLNATGWTNVSQADVSGRRLYVDRRDARPVGIGGTADAISVQSLDLSNTDGQTDLVADAGGDWTLVVNNTGLSQGTGLVVVDQSSGEPLDADSVGPNGNVVFDELGGVQNAELNIKQGPAELQVFEEANPDTLVTGVTLRVRVFGEDSVTERQITDGTMDLTGIPSDERLVLTVSEDSTNDYAYRRNIVESVEQQSGVYLLNTTSNQQDVDVVFELQDRTGNYPASDTTLFIEKPIRKDFDGDGTDETRYQTIAGDLFGGTAEFTTVLEGEERYRLRLENAQGDQRMLGAYTAQLNDRVTLNVGRISIQANGRQSFAADVRTFTNDTDSDGTEEQFVRVVYVDADRRTESLDYTIRNRTGSTLVTSQTLQGPFGEHVATYQVADQPVDATYRLTWNATRQTDSGVDRVYSGTTFAGSVPGFFGAIPLDPRWAALLGYVSIVAVAGLVVITEPALGGLAATGWAAALTIIGIVTIPAPALGLSGALSVIALLGRAQP
jgi:hypothetical protein